MARKKNATLWVAIIGLIGVIITAYFNYQQEKNAQELEKYKFDQIAKKDEQKYPLIRGISSNDSRESISIFGKYKLIVEYSVEGTSIGLNIGNTSPEGIIILSDLTLNWDYSECPKFRSLSPGAPTIEYRYEIAITNYRDSKLIDTREFKYGPGDVDSFNIDIIPPAAGVYNIWIEFKYREFGASKNEIFQTKKLPLEICTRMRSVKPDHRKKKAIPKEEVSSKQLLEQIYE